MNRVTKKFRTIMQAGVIFALIFSFAFVPYFSAFVPHKPAFAQLAVPVFEVNPLIVGPAPGTILGNTLLITFATQDAARNTARLSAKETGLGFGYPLPNVPYTGIQLARDSIVSPSADSITTVIIKQLIKSFTRSIVQWINSGFQGGPTFITDPDKFFLGVADRVAGNFIEGSELGFLCEPFRLDIQLALGLNYSSRFEDRIGCTLTDVVNNVEGFVQGGNFQDGGWPGWISLTQNSHNNPYGAYIDAHSELAIRLQTSQRTEEIKLGWGKGFLSSQDCIQYRVDANADGNVTEDECTQLGPIKTPGTIIEGQLGEALGTDLRQFELADEFDEIIGALIGYVLNSVLLKGGGLLGS